jgi:dTDP-4-dehydrorhamnose 3,5-epimerase
MNIIETQLEDCLLIEPKVFEDERGFFLESFNLKKYENVLGSGTIFVQDNHSKSSRGVLRGLHLQRNKPQGKLVRVIKGEILDVVVDLRKSSSSYCRWQSFRISSKNKHQLWVPPGFAHGFVVLSEISEVEYKVTDYYDPSDEISLLWNDVDLKIDWLIKNPILSDKDRNASTFQKLDL